MGLFYPSQMTEIKIYLGGEGANELGSRSGASAYRSGNVPGLVETLLSRVEPSGWRVAGATQWKCIRKFRGKGPTLDPEQRNVLDLVEMADAAKADIVAFGRDADGDSERPKTIESAMRKAAAEFPGVAIVGGSAIPVLEGWILAMRGQHGTEGLSKAGAQRRLKDLGIDKDTAGMAQLASQVDIERLPKDAGSLRSWLSTAKEILPPLVREARELETQIP